MVRGWKDQRAGRLLNFSSSLSVMYAIYPCSRHQNWELEQISRASICNVGATLREPKVETRRWWPLESWLGPNWISPLGTRYGSVSKCVRSRRRENTNPYNSFCIPIQCFKQSPSTPTYMLHPDPMVSASYPRLQMTMLDDSSATSSLVSHFSRLLLESLIIRV